MRYVNFVICSKIELHFVIHSIFYVYTDSLEQRIDHYTKRKRIEIVDDSTSD